MSWRLQLHPPVSRAEIQVFEELSRRRLTGDMVSQQTVVLKKAVPDFMWIGQRKVVFIDGVQVHRGGQADRDAEVDGLLDLQGWRVLRVEYRAPLTRRRLFEIADEIERFLKK
jgi:very-short-patch-repair endonuclease